MLLATHSRMTQLRTTPARGLCVRARGHRIMKQRFCMAFISLASWLAISVCQLALASPYQGTIATLIFAPDVLLAVPFDPLFQSRF